MSRRFPGSICGSMRKFEISVSRRATETPVSAFCSLEGKLQVGEVSKEVKQWKAQKKRDYRSIEIQYILRIQLPVKNLQKVVKGKKVLDMKWGPVAILAYTS